MEDDGCHIVKKLHDNQYRRRLVTFVLALYLVLEVLAKGG